MGSADPIVLKPRKASPLTAGEKKAIPSLDSAHAVFIDTDRQNASNSVPAHNPDMIDFNRNI
jgi:hypothetical protein